MSRELQDILDKGEIDDLLMDAAYDTTAGGTDAQVATKEYVDDADDLKASISYVDLGSSFTYRAITALRTLDATDFIVNCTANSFTVTLPTVVGITGKMYHIKNSGSGTITVDADGTETIDGSLTQTLYQYDNLLIMSTNTGWIIL